MSRNVELEDRMTKFAARCVKVCEALPPKRIGSMSFADQLFRSSTSVAANYAEATQSESRKDFVHKLKIALKVSNSLPHFCTFPFPPFSHYHISIFPHYILPQ